MFYHDHKEAIDPAVSVLRLDDPIVEGQVVTGKWKVFFDAKLLRSGEANPVELYDLTIDSRETTNRIHEPALKSLVEELSGVALLHRTSGGHRTSELASPTRHVIDWVSDEALRAPFQKMGTKSVTITRDDISVEVSIAQADDAQGFHLNSRGLGITGGDFDQVDHGEAIVIRSNRDILVESLAIVAGNGTCGGFYTVADHAPLAIYCVDADIDEKDQSGILSDIGVLKAGEALTLSSSPHLGVETPGQWRLGGITIRELAP
jgi:hypothetical protein